MSLARSLRSLEKQRKSLIRFYCCNPRIVLRFCLPLRPLRALRETVLFLAVCTALPLCRQQVRIHHHVDQLVETGLRLPTQFRLGLGRVPEEEVDLGGTEVLGIDLDDDLAAPGIEPLLVA